MTKSKRTKSKHLPNLKRIMVDVEKLVWDPNNPRFLTKESDRVHQDNILDATSQANTHRRMFDKNDSHNIKQIIDSITKNGWQPVDSIFVQQLEDARYVVLEGNRRLTAINAILTDEDAPETLKLSLKRIEVEEILDKVDGRSPEKSRAKLNEKIAYLLGIRHHGSLKEWPVFAQAKNIYLRYLEVACQTDSTFEWEDDIAKQIAATLGVKTSKIKERIRVYRGMLQIANYPKVKNSESGEGDDEGGVKASHYSVCKEALITTSEKLGAYIKVNDVFELDDCSLERIVELCHFHKKDRAGSPINNPQQWRFLQKILGDDNATKKEINLQRVIEGKERPEDVWSERYAELTIPDWHRWLDEVALLFSKLSFGNFEETDEAREVVNRLTNVLNKLGSK
jgi:hypothetical protein